ncbi:MAG: OmpA family protein [Cytophagaceae bacterium]
MIRILLFILLLLSSFSLLHAQNYTPRNMGPAINSPDNTDAYPAISPDGRFFFHSRDGSATKGNYDIFYSELLPDGTWSESVPVDELNNAEKNTVYYIYPDGNTILIEGIYGKEPSINGVSRSTRTATGWSIPEPLEFEGSPEWGNHSVSLSLDGTKMLMSLGQDLHVSFLKENGTWSNPQKIPDNINTSNMEYTPFLANDDKTMYYSSQRPDSYGLNDIYKTTRLDDTWLKWSEPENLGSRINSTSWESFFSIGAKGDYAYVYKLDIGNGDIMQIELEKKNKPQSVVLVKGKVYNAKTNEPIAAAIHYEILPEGSDAGTVNTSPKEGAYNIILPYGKQYGYHARAEGFLGVNENMDLSEINDYKEITQDLYLIPIEVGQSMKLNNVFFVQGKPEMLKSSYPELDRLAKILQDNPTIVIELSGHTDNQGSADLNMQLSVSRVKAVKDYLVSKGVKEDRILGKGYGGTKPVASNDSEQTRKLNRRVEFTILKK